MKELKECNVLAAGSGAMGAGIAQALAAAGHQVCRSRRKEGASMAGAKARIQEAAGGLISEGLATEDCRAAVAANLRCITNDELPNIGGGIDIVFESIFEDPKAKRNLCNARAALPRRLHPGEQHVRDGYLLGLRRCHLQTRAAGGGALAQSSAPNEAGGGGQGGLMPPARRCRRWRACWSGQGASRRR